jgi:hypothetical protein
MALRGTGWFLTALLCAAACSDDGGDAGSTDTGDGTSGADTTTSDGSETGDTGSGSETTSETMGTETTSSSGGADGDPCNPLAAECDAGLGCYPVPTDMFECAPEGSAGQEEKCNSETDCADGFYCAASISLVDCKGPQCCTAYCDLDGDDCPDAYHCAAYFPPDEAPNGLENVGICVAN